MKFILVATAAIFAFAGPVMAADDTAKKSVGYSFIEGAFAHDNFNANGVGINDRDGIGNTADDNFGRLSDATGNGGGARASIKLPFGSNVVGFHFVTDYLQTAHDAGLAIADEFGVPTASGTVAVDQKEFRAAFGVHSTASRHLSFFAELGITSNKINLGTASLATPVGLVSANLAGASGSRTAMDGRLGVRGIALTRTEFLAYARYHGNGKFVTAANGDIGFSDKIVAGAGVYYHLTDSVQLGGDYEFGTPGRLRIVARFTF